MHVDLPLKRLVEVRKIGRTESTISQREPLVKFLSLGNFFVWEAGSISGCHENSLRFWRLSLSITKYRQKEYIIASALGFHGNFDVSGHDVTLNMDWQHLTVSGCSKGWDVKELKW